jgi:hypothetical protein
VKKDGFYGQTTLLLTIILLILAAELLVLTGCGGDELQSHRPTTVMATDGSWTEWKEIPLHRVEEMNGLVLGVANDNEYLYLMARSSDLQLARRLRMLGLVVQASGQSDGGSELVVRYHGSVALSDNLMRAGGGPGGGRMPQLFETGENTGIPTPGMIEVQQGGRAITAPENRPEGTAAGSDVEGDMYCYEFRLPLDALFAGPALDGGLAGQKVQLELQGGNMTKEMRQQLILLRNSRGERGERGGGMGGGMGGSHRGGDQRGGDSMVGGMGGPGGARAPGGQGREPRKLKVTIRLS